MNRRTPQQQIAHAQALLDRARERARKADAHRKIVLGGLVIAAGVDGWNEAEIVGALLSADASLSGPDRDARRHALRQQGIAHLERRKVARAVCG
ncbi:MAG TPA: conjugal transfer protein TraD [Rhodanobacteraceae bacterium]|nr:conjugal transfer protein TraD [Rhodanobacteraceae bacterium]